MSPTVQLIITAGVAVLQTVCIWILSDLRDRVRRLEDRYIERRGK